MSTPPEIPEDEYLRLARWMTHQALVPSEERQELFRAAYRYAAERTGLTKEEVKRLVAYFENFHTNDAARWVEHYLNECRKTGTPPTDHHE